MDRKAYKKQWYTHNRERLLKQRKENRLSHLEKFREKDRVYRSNHPRHSRQQDKLYRAIRKEKVFSYYGNKCQWPEGCDVTDPDMLQIDHIDGEGNKHRKEMGFESIYSFLIRNSFPL